MCSVDKTGCEAIITQRALVFLSAVASRFRFCGGSAENFVVMLLNDAFHVIHTAVANFNCVFVENFVVPMVFRKVLLDQAQKYFSTFVLTFLLNGGLKTIGTTKFSTKTQLKLATAVWITWNASLSSITTKFSALPPQNRNLDATAERKTSAR